MYKYNHIISNPPYSIGNIITKNVVDSIDYDDYINLMPVSKYKGQKLYLWVKSAERVADTFEDAVVGNSLIIAVLGEKDEELPRA